MTELTGIRACVFGLSIGVGLAPLIGIQKGL